MLNLGNKTPQIKKHERGADELSGLARKNETYVQMELFDSPKLRSSTHAKTKIENWFTNTLRKTRNSHIGNAVLGAVVATAVVGSVAFAQGNGVIVEDLTAKNGQHTLIVNSPFDARIIVNTPDEAVVANSAQNNGKIYLQAGTKSGQKLTFINSNNSEQEIGGTGEYQAIQSKISSAQSNSVYTNLIAPPQQTSTSGSSTQSGSTSTTSNTQAFYGLQLSQTSMLPTNQYLTSSTENFTFYGVIYVPTNVVNSNIGTVDELIGSTNNSNVGFIVGFVNGSNNSSLNVELSYASPNNQWSTLTLPNAVVPGVNVFSGEFNVSTDTVTFQWNGTSANGNNFQGFQIQELLGTNQVLPIVWGTPSGLSVPSAPVVLVSGGVTLQAEDPSSIVQNAYVYPNLINGNALGQGSYPFNNGSYLSVNSGTIDGFPSTKIQLPTQ